MSIEEYGSSFRVWICAGFACLLALGAQAAVAQETSVPGNRDAITQALVAQWLPAVEAIGYGRDDTWSSGEWMDEFEEALTAASDRELQALSEAQSYGEVQTILAGDASAATAGDGLVAPPASLGSLTQDFVFTPVAPCRIFDTRPASGGSGAIPAGGTKSFNVHGGVAGQGGNLAGCASPRGEPRAVHLNVTAVPVGGNGNLRVFPFNTPVPNASLVNFKLGTNVANAGTVQTAYLLGPDISVYASQSAHVLGDVLGYYHEVDRTTTYYATIGDGGFIPRSSVNYFTASGQGGTYSATSGSNTAFMGSVQLPHGATVTSFSALVEDSYAGDDIRVYLQWQANVGFGNMAQVSTSGTPGVVTLTDNTISSAMIDNVNRSYAVFAISDNWPGDWHLRIKRAVIAYTLEEF